MISDDELTRLRRLYCDAVFGPAGRRLGIMTLVELVHDPKGETIQAVLDDQEVPPSVVEALRAAVFEIGLAHAADVLEAAVLPVEDVQKNQRWQMRRLLARAVDAIDEAALQQLLWRAQGLATDARIAAGDHDQYDSRGLDVLRGIKREDGE